MYREQRRPTHNSAKRLSSWAERKPQPQPSNSTAKVTKCRMSYTISEDATKAFGAPCKRGFAALQVRPGLGFIATKATSLTERQSRYKSSTQVSFLEIAEALRLITSESGASGTSRTPEEGRGGSGTANAKGATTTTPSSSAVHVSKNSHIISRNSLLNSGSRSPSVVRQEPRRLTDQLNDDEVLRSMARRRKSDRPGDIIHTCRECAKQFKRLCDLTKHEKTHSRPWKCSEEKCKYFDLGWPTEKERDRHVNDKHSVAPAQYKCLYPPCTYASKRESNCKQHMEKAHGWVRVGPKRNVRKGMLRQVTPIHPSLSNPQPVTLTTPITPLIPSPTVPKLDTFDYYSFGMPAVTSRFSRLPG